MMVVDLRGATVGRARLPRSGLVQSDYCIVGFLVRACRLSEVIMVARTCRSGCSISVATITELSLLSRNERLALLAYRKHWDLGDIKVPSAAEAMQNRQCMVNLPLEVPIAETREW